VLLVMGLIYAVREAAVHLWTSAAAQSIPLPHMPDDLHVLRHYRWFFPASATTLYAAMECQYRAGARQLTGPLLRQAYPGK